MESYNHIEFWLQEIKTQSSPDIKLFLIGNKIDLEENRKVPTELASKFSKENHLNYFNETSAKNGFNAQKVFIEAAQCLYEEHLKYKERANNFIPSESSNVKLPKPGEKPKETDTEKKKSCC